MAHHSTSKPRYVVHVGTIQEYFAYTDWARDKVLSAAAGLNEQQLDRPFEMGEGSIRKTLNHLFASECVWLDRWEGHPKPRYPIDSTGVTMNRLWEEFRQVAARRNRFLASQSDAQLLRDLTYTNLRGETYTFPVGMMMLHVCVHGSHHRAQAINMLRRVGSPLPKPGADYIFMKMEQPGGTACALDVETLQTCFAFSDWAQRAMFHACKGLSDAQLDRKFEIGMGTLRKTMSHIRDAEAWWLSNWSEGPGMAFPPADGKLPIAEIERSFNEIAEKRNQMLRGMPNADVNRPVSANPRPGLTLTFPIGVTMLQLCHHGVHHRAQALNMLRHTGAALPSVDLLSMLK